MSVVRDPYEVLGVPRTATTREIRAAYVRHARRAHPDLNGGKGGDVMGALNEAWEILKDAARRQAWDAVHHAGAPAHPRYGADQDLDVDGRPFWTGAMGPPPGRPWGPVLHFGIYDGWSLGEISRRDRGYLIWLRDRPEGRSIRAEVERLLEPSSDEPAPHREQRRRFGRR